MVDNGWRPVSHVDMDEDVNLHGPTYTQATTASTRAFVCTDSHTEAHMFQHAKPTSGK